MFFNDSVFSVVHEPFGIRRKRNDVVSLCVHIFNG